MLKFLTLLIFILTLLYIPIAVYYVSLLQQEDQIKKEILTLGAKNIPLISPTPEIKKESMLPEIVNNNFSEYGEEYAVVIKNLKTSEEYKFNENKKYNSASLYKLWVMAVAYEKIKDGVLKEDQIISGNQKKFDDALSTVSPTPSLEISPDQTQEEVNLISMTLQNAIDKMIINSDNYAALLIASKIGAFSVTNFLKSNDFKDSNFKQPPKTTASDIASYYEKLYNGQIVDNEYSIKMMEILRRQAINDRIPKKLPSEVKVAHKTGELFGAKHDAGIVFTPKGDYIIVILSDTKDPNIAVKKMADFSLQIYNYFQSN